MAQRCTVQLLGGFAVAVDGRPVSPDAWRSRRAADLVRLLALAPGHRMHREEVMAALWPDLSAEAAAANLRKAIHFARRAMGGERSVGSSGDLLSLWPDAVVDVDVAAFEAAATAALGSGDPAECAAVARRYPGELLPQNRYEQWASARRQQLRDRYLTLLRTAEMWPELLALEPLDEPAHRALMRQSIVAGNRGAALRRFDQLRCALRDELGVPPDEATIALHDEARADGGPAAQPVEEVRSLLARALVAWHREDHAAVESAATRARSLALEHRLAQELGEASGLLARVAYARGRWVESFRAEFGALVRRPPALAVATFDALLCFTEFDLDGPNGSAATAALAHELLAVADAANSAIGAAIARLLLGEADLLAGRLAAAGDQLRDALRLHRAAGCDSGAALAAQRLAEVELAAGRARPAGRLLDDAESLAARSPAAGHLVVRILGTRVAVAGRVGRGLVAVRAAERALAGSRACEPCSMAYLVGATVASARAGDVERAERHLTAAERIAGMWQGGGWQAAVWEARAAIRAATGEPDQAAALLREAARGYERAGRPADAARCRGSG